jgi:hypothetical protein
MLARRKISGGSDVGHPRHFPLATHFAYRKRRKPDGARPALLAGNQRERQALVVQLGMVAR